jgi:hypothetical protein
MPQATVKMISNPEATRVFLWPHIKRAYSGLRSITGVDLHALGSVQAGRGVVRMVVHTKMRRQKDKVYTLFGNYDTHGGSKNIYQFLRFLQHHGFGTGSYGAPIPLVYSPKYKLLVYESFPGKRVRDELEAGKLSARGLETVMRQSAVWLKKFHRLPPRVGTTRNLRLAPVFFSQLTKEHRLVIDAALPFIHRELSRRDKKSLVHGDPHLANCIQETKKSFAFIDFSESYIGSPAADIAMYLVHLDVALQPFFSRHAIARAQRVFLETYYARSLEKIDRRTRRTLLAFELRTAALFLRFTSDHHRQPSRQVAWMIQHFVNIISRGTDELRGNDPQLILAT